MAEARAEITGFILRIYDNPTVPYGDPFDLIISAIADEGHVTLKGILSTPDAGVTYAHYRAVCAELKHLGFKSVMWRRYENGVPREVRRTL